MSLEEEKRLSSALSHVPGLVAAWLFGSAGRGQPAPGSDVDVAVLFGTEPGLDTVGRALAACQDSLQRDDVDLVVLNSASPILAFEALNGRRLLTLAPQEASAFESLIAREYEDEYARMAKASGYPADREASPAP